jgi:hypothetical protein
LRALEGLARDPVKVIEDLVKKRLTAKVQHGEKYSSLETSNELAVKSS